MPNQIRLFVLYIFFLPSVFAIGCNRTPPLDPDVPADARIARLLLDVDDFAQDPDELKSKVPRLFAPGCAPSEKELQRYAAYRYEAKPAVRSGDTATAIVTVKDAKSEAVVGEMKWTVKLVDNIWKITDAPLPAK